MQQFSVEVAESGCVAGVLASNEGCSTWGGDGCQRRNGPVGSMAR